MGGLVRLGIEFPARSLLSSAECFGLAAGEPESSPAECFGLAAGEPESGAATPPQVAGSPSPAASGPSNVPERPDLEAGHYFT
ncbi:hypothetical protein Q5425_28575 [Amycolatopsis sp. A133]|uniref:hypothetical protein n=1 Tax=Amycolatopsis sp. A133 TaxID=3064472 RepID=UPI0027F37AA9|nr:hypothetical protein [Amycolatopsis sp. A133]MDQ7807708.1 hypothetical protein [Amycolatopsis sp. A133]